MRLDRFFAQKIDNSLDFTWSKKVKEALEKIAKRTRGEQIDDDLEVVEVKRKEAEQPKKTRKRAPTKKKNAKNPPKNTKKVAKKLVLSEESSENDSFDDDVV